MGFNEFREISEGFEVEEANFDINSSLSGSSNNAPNPGNNNVLGGYDPDADWEDIPEDSILEEESIDTDREDIPEDTEDSILEEESIDEVMLEDTGERTHHI